VVYTPGAELVHAGSASRKETYDLGEHLPFLQKYGRARDRFVNDNLDVDAPWMSPDPHKFAHAARRKRPLSALLVTHNLNREGAPLILLDYARHFVAAAGHRLTVASPTDGPLRAAYEAIGVRVEVTGKMTPDDAESLDAWRARLDALGRRLDLGRADVVVCNTVLTFWAMELAARLGLPTVWHVHEGLDAESAARTLFGASAAPRIRPLLEACLMRATRVVFQAEDTARRLWPSNTRDQFRVLPGAVDLAAIDAFRAAHPRDALRQKYGIAPDDYVLLEVGTVCERKAQHLLVEALKQLEFSGIKRRLRCLFVGAREDDATRAYLSGVRDRIARLGLSDVVRLVDETDDALDYLQLADLFVLPSLNESFPRSLLEAMAFGLPIIATRICGVPEMIAHEHDGLLVPPGHPEALTTAILRCLRQADFAAEMGRRGFAKARRLYDATRLCEAQLALLDEAYLVGSVAG
jgi:glycosyltransferase involved in cell wall biosynthesis